MPMMPESSSFKKSTMLLTVIALSSGAAMLVQGFSIPPVELRSRTGIDHRQTVLHAKKKKNDDSDTSFLLDDFRVATGEVVNPYRVLKIPRDADRKQVKQAYRDLSRRFHPDGARFREILPGHCSNDDDIREHWEKIKLSYEILSDKKMRQKYDRNSAVVSPASAVGRSVLNGVGWGLMGMAKGIAEVSVFAMDKMIGDDDDKDVFVPDVQTNDRDVADSGMPPHNMTQPGSVMA